MAYDSGRCSLGICERMNRTLPRVPGVRDAGLTPSAHMSACIERFCSYPVPGIRDAGLCSLGTRERLHRMLSLKPAETPLSHRHLQPKHRYIPVMSRAAAKVFAGFPVTEWNCFFSGVHLYDYRFCEFF